MQLKVLRGLSRLSTRSTLLATFSLAGAALAGGCASELDNPDGYAAAIAGGGGAPPTVTGGTPGAPTGGTVSTTGGAAAGGTPTAGGSPGGGAPPLPACAKTVLAQCTSCHGPTTKDFFGGLDLAGDTVGERLRNATAKNMMATNAATCGSMLINAESPAQSVMLKRVAGKSDCGDVMPPGLPLNAADLKCIQDWVMTF